MQMCNDQIRHLLSQSSERNHTTSVFDTTFTPNIEKGQFTPPVEDLAADAFTFVLAGTDTTSHTLCTGLFELLDDSQPHMIARLKQEIREAIPDTQVIVDWASLEPLPYLVCILEFQHIHDI